MSVCIRCHGSGDEPIGDVTINGLPLTTGQLRYLFSRLFWKHAIDADLNTVDGCDQAGSLAAEFLTFLDQDADVGGVPELPHYAGRAQSGRLPDSDSAVVPPGDKQ